MSLITHIPTNTGYSASFTLTLNRSIARSLVQPPPGSPSQFRTPKTYGYEGAPSVVPK